MLRRAHRYPEHLLSYLRPRRIAGAATDTDDAVGVGCAEFAEQVVTALLDTRQALQDGLEELPVVAGARCQSRL